MRRAPCPEVVREIVLGRQGNGADIEHKKYAKKICKKYAKYASNMQVLIILLYFVCNMQNMQNTICTICNLKICQTQFQYAEYALPTLLMLKVPAV